MPASAPKVHPATARPIASSIKAFLPIADFVPMAEVRPYGFVCGACGAAQAFRTLVCDVCGACNRLEPRTKLEAQREEARQTKLRAARPERALADPTERLDDLGRARALREIRRGRKLDPSTDVGEWGYDPALDGFGSEGGEGVDDGEGGGPADPLDEVPEPPELAMAPVGTVKADKTPRIATGVEGLDRVLDAAKGRGAKLGKVISVTGDPGVGKSTLLRQACAIVAARDRELVVYCSAEEPSSDIRAEIERVGLLSKHAAKHLEILGNDMEHFDDIDAVCKMIDERQPIFAVVDALQEYRTYTDPFTPGVAGDKSQVIYVARALVEACEANGTLLFLVGHITQDRKTAGPKLVEHLVHATLRIEHGHFVEKGSGKKAKIAWERLEDPPEDGTESLVRCFNRKNRGGARASRFFRMTHRGLMDFDPEDAVGSKDAGRAEPAPSKPARGVSGRVGGGGKRGRGRGDADRGQPARRKPRRRRA